jgi:CDGSH-type Zn-finger protein/uncharacterized Fe-S cluster protein YjdI
MSSNELTKYPGKDTDVTWDERLCIHIGECGGAKGELFIAGRKPWCKPDLVKVEEVIDVIKRCPSGALSFQRHDSGEEEQANKDNAVVVSYNGPLFVRGDLDIEGATNDMPALKYRAALCRCGQSKNKPFCDNSHEETGFKDFGSVGEKGEGYEEAGGKLIIKAIKDGPLMLMGNFSINASSGRVAWQGTQAALCRCGHSKNKPFCDGSHKEAGFKSG